MTSVSFANLLNLCFGLDEHSSGICTCLVGRDLIARALKENTDRHAVFFSDRNMIALLKEANVGRSGFMTQKLPEDLLSAPASHRDPANLEQIQYLHLVSVLVPWFFNKGIYAYEPQGLTRQLQQMQAQEQEQEQEQNTVFAPLPLPQWSIFVQLPEISDLPPEDLLLYPRCLYKYAGFFAALQEEDGVQHLCLLPIGEDHALGLRLRLTLSGGDENAALAGFKAQLEAWQSGLQAHGGAENILKELKAHADAALQLARPLYQLTAALCREDACFTDGEGQAAVPANIAPALLDGREVSTACLQAQYFTLK